LGEYRSLAQGVLNMSALNSAMVPAMTSLLRSPQSEGGVRVVPASDVSLLEFARARVELRLVNRAFEDFLVGSDRIEVGPVSDSDITRRAQGFSALIAEVASKE
jgi:hypothetical protein